MNRAFAGANVFTCKMGLFFIFENSAYRSKIRLFNRRFVQEVKNQAVFFDSFLFIKFYVVSLHRTLNGVWLCWRATLQGIHV